MFDDATAQRPKTSYQVSDHGYVVGHHDTAAATETAAKSYQTACL